MPTLAFIFRAHSALVSRLRNVRFRALGTRIDGYAWLRRVSIPRQWSDVRIEAGVALDDGVTLLCSDAPKRDKIVVGARSYINRNTILDASESLTIGDDCMIGPGCYLTDHDHSTKAGLPPGSQPLISKPTFLGNRVWLGAHVVVLKGVTIGDDAVVGAGAVVTRNVAAGTTVAGVPARPLAAKRI